MKERKADPDSQLIERILKQDKAAFNELVQRHWSKAFARAYQLLDNVQDAEEVTQDAFSRVYQNLSSFRGDAAFSTWLFQIVTNLARNRFWFTMRRGRKLNISLQQPLQESAEHTWETCLECPRNQPQDETCLRELSRTIQDALPNLPDIYREVLQLRIYREMSYDAISQQLQLPVGTIKSRIARARKMLLQNLPDQLLPESLTAA